MSQKVSRAVRDRIPHSQTLSCSFGHLFSCIPISAFPKKVWITSVNDSDISMYVVDQWLNFRDSSVQLVMIPPSILACSGMSHLSPPNHPLQTFSFPACIAWALEQALVFQP